MTPIELKFVKHSETSDYYIVYYRFKEFIPEEIFPTSIIGKFLHNFCGKKKFTKNNWNYINSFIYGWDNEWIHIGRHPKDWLGKHMIKYSDINTFKETYKSLEDIKSFEDEENANYQKMVELYNEQQKTLKDEIF